MRYYYDAANEPDDERYEQRRHCSRCGSFLTKEPTFPGRTEFTVFRPFTYTDPYLGCEVTDRVPHRATQEEIEQGKAMEEYVEPAWTCQRCKHSHGLDDMWI